MLISTYYLCQGFHLTPSKGLGHYQLIADFSPPKQASSLNTTVSASALRPQTYKKTVRLYHKKASPTESTDETNKNLLLLLSKKQAIRRPPEEGEIFPVATIKICPRFALGDLDQQDLGDSNKLRKKASQVPVPTVPNLHRNGTQKFLWRAATEAYFS